MVKPAALTLPLSSPQARVQAYKQSEADLQQRLTSTLEELDNLKIEHDSRKRELAASRSGNAEQMEQSGVVDQLRLDLSSLQVQLTPTALQRTANPNPNRSRRTKR